MSEGTEQELTNRRIFEIVPELPYVTGQGGISGESRLRNILGENQMGFTPVGSNTQNGGISYDAAMLYKPDGLWPEPNIFPKPGQFDAKRDLFYNQIARRIMEWKSN